MKKGCEKTACGTYGCRNQVTYKVSSISCSNNDESYFGERGCFALALDIVGGAGVQAGDGSVREVLAPLERIGTDIENIRIVAIVIEMISVPCNPWAKHFC